MELSISRLEPLKTDALGLEGKIVEIFPEDALKTKRKRNLLRARYIILALSGDQIAGVLFIRNVLGIPNTTWIVSEAFWRKGVAFRLLEYAQKDFPFLTAVCRNEPSARLAKKAGFRVLPLGLATWNRYL